MCHWLSTCGSEAPSCYRAVASEGRYRFSSRLIPFPTIEATEAGEAVTVEPDEEDDGRDAKSMVAVFHLVNSLLPDEQSVVSVRPGTLVREAFALMRHYGFSQLPVMEGGLVVGVFSHRSFATWAAGQKTVALDRLEVDDCLEDFEFVRATAELEAMFEYLDRDGAVLVGDPDRLIAVATPTDLIQYLYGVTHPFVLIQEIELVLRGLVHAAVAKNELSAYIRRAISNKYNNAEVQIPTELVDLTFAELVQTVIHGTNYSEAFCKILGRNRESARGYLSPVTNIRNDVFHFRRPISGEDLQTLANTRTWLLRKARTFQARGGVGHDIG
jgi:CBS domain